MTFNRIKELNDYLKPRGLRAFAISSQSKIDIERIDNSQIVKTFFKTRLSDLTEGDLEALP